MKKVFVAMAILGVLGGLILSSTPVNATIQGTAYFNCNVTLPTWPTESGGAVTCKGKATAVLTGRTTTGQNYTTQGANKPFTGAATFYNEKCTFDEPLNGSAGGTTTISKLSNGGTATSNFSWSRVGLTAVVTLTNGKVTLSGGKTAVGTSIGRAVAAFRPTQPRLGERTCTNKGQQKANVQGVAIFPS